MSKIEKLAGITPTNATLYIVESAGGISRYGRPSDRYARLWLVARTDGKQPTRGGETAKQTVLKRIDWIQTNGRYGQRNIDGAYECLRNLAANALRQQIRHPITR